MEISLEGKTAIVTGANTGIGKPTVTGLAKRGCKVIMACRDEEKARAAKSDILEDDQIQDEQIIFMKLDLNSLQSVKEFAEKFNSEQDRLDIVVNNAAVYTPTREETVEGFEAHMGINHLGHFLLTNLLLDKLKACAPSRIVNVAAEGHMFGPIDFDDFQSTQNWSSFTAVSRSKSANILFTVELAKRLKGTGVTAYSLHPGFVKTNIARRMGRCSLINIIYCLCPFFAKSPDQGSRTTLYCCIDPKLATESGKYYSGCREKPAKPHATNPELAEKLWSISEKLVGLKTTD